MRQLGDRAAGSMQWAESMTKPNTPAFRITRESQKMLLEFLLSCLPIQKPLELDHDPPLAVRQFNPRTGKYKPDANDPNHLFYRTAEDHRVKTNIRGEHGQYSDRTLIKRERRRQKPKKPSHWPKRRFGS
jgi:hypothetical protein